MKNRLYVSLRLIMMIVTVSLITQCRKDETEITVIDTTSYNVGILSGKKDPQEGFIVEKLLNCKIN